MKKLLSVILLICVVLCFPSCSDDKSVKEDGTNKGDIAPYTSFISHTASCWCIHSYEIFEWEALAPKSVDDSLGVKIVAFDGSIHLCIGKKISAPNTTAPHIVNSYRIESVGGDSLYFNIETGKFMGFLAADYLEKEYKIQNDEKSVTEDHAYNKAKKIVSKFVSNIESYDVEYELCEKKFGEKTIEAHKYVFSTTVGNYITSERIDVTIGPSGDCLSFFAQDAGLYNNIETTVSEEQLQNSIDQKIQTVFNLNKNSDPPMYPQLTLKHYETDEQYIVNSNGYIGIMTRYSVSYDLIEAASLQISEKEENSDWMYIFTVIEYIGE